jgi:hypothetical protein
MNPNLLRQLKGPNGPSARSGWTPHALQEEIIRSDARNKVVAAGRRSGKSQTGGHILAPYAFTALAEKDELTAKGIRRQYWIVGPEYSDGEKEFRVLYHTLKRLGVPFDKPGTYNNPVTGQMNISLWEGLYKVDVLSAKYPESLVGEGVSGVVLSEAAKIKPTVWPKFLRPTLADFGGWAFMSSTPEGRNWFYRMWQAGQDPDRPDWASWRAPAWVNPHVYRGMRLKGVEAEAAVRALQEAYKKKRIPEHLPFIPGIERFMTDEQWMSAVDRSWRKVGEALGVDEEIVSLILDLSPELFNQEIAADFNEFVGRVFKEFDEEVHVADLSYDPAWSTYAALDYGFTNPFVWLLIQVDPFGENIRILDEYYERGRTTEEAGREIRGRGLAPGSLTAMYPDPAEPDRSAQLSHLLEVRSEGGTGGALTDRLEWIKRFLKPDPKVAHLDIDHPEWMPRLQINRRCKMTIHEFNAYRYPKTAEEAAERDQQAPEVPLKKDDHAIEALGRFMIGHFGSPWAEVVSPPTQRAAKIGRRRPARR